MAFSHEGYTAVRHYGTDFLQRSITRSTSWDRLRFFAGNLNPKKKIMKKYVGPSLAPKSVFPYQISRTRFLRIPCTPKQNVFCCCSFKASKGSPWRGFKITQIPNTKRKTRVKPGTVAHKGHGTNKKVAANKIKYKDGWNFVGSNYHVTWSAFALFLVRRTEFAFNIGHFF